MFNAIRAKYIKTLLLTANFQFHSSSLYANPERGTYQVRQQRGQPVPSFWLCLHEWFYQLASYRKLGQLVSKNNKSPFDKIYYHHKLNKSTNHAMASETGISLDEVHSYYGAELLIYVQRF
jgi:hypothetical protein